MATTYTYTTNIPVATHTPAQDQGNMQVNCTSVSQILATDHLTFGTATDALTDGMHTVVHLVVQANDPPAVAGTGEIYTKEVTFNSVIESALFFESDQGTVTQLTSPSSILATSPGYIFLPGGLIMQWGTVTGSFIGNPVAITYPIKFPNNVFNVTAMLNKTSLTANGDEYSVVNIGKTSSGLFVTPGYMGAPFEWFAIGN